jgi:hypothetical protein
MSEMSIRTRNSPYVVEREPHTLDLGFAVIAVSIFVVAIVAPYAGFTQWETPYFEQTPEDDRR